MGMGINASRHDVTAASVDDLRTLGGIDFSRNGGNGLAVDQNIAASRMIVIHDRAAANEYAHEALSFKATARLSRERKPGRDVR
jgi:hypothetical protein